MNKCQIKKIISVGLTFSNFSIIPSVASSALLKNVYLNNEYTDIAKRFTKSSYPLKIKDSNSNQESTNVDSIQNIIAMDSQKNVIDENIKIEINELFIESKELSEKDNILYAVGEVVVRYKGNILKADSLSYNKETKFAKADGNIELIINNQIFQADMIEYDFVNKKGDFNNVKGLIDFESIISDLDFNSKRTYKNLLSTIQSMQKDKVVYTPNKLTNWIFSAKYLKVDPVKLSSKQVFLTNDLLNSNQVKIQINDLKVYSAKEKLQLKSKINYLIFEDKVPIPFWFGDRTILKKSGNTYKDFFENQNRLNIGYEKLNKDGIFIGRKLNSIKIKNDLFLNIEPQFLLQRTLKGKTKSFVQKNYSLNSPRVERNISLSDYFALNSSIDGKIKNWDLKIIKELNSFDLDKFANAFRTRGELSKEIYLFNNTFVSRIFGAYRERIWNGSIGESEIYNAYGWRLDKTDSWNNGSVEKNQIITFGLGNYKAEGLNNSEFVESYKGSISYQLNQRIPLYEKKIDSQYVDKSFKYIPKPIAQGLFMNSKMSLNNSLYKYGNSQKYLGFSLGPEIIIGNFKKDFLDYTRLKVTPFYKFKSGNSVFKFDQVSENLTLDLNFDQQIIGPWLIETQGTLNLDKDSNDYGEFINSRIGMNFKKRSYNFGIFYQPHNQAGGIKFTLNGFK